MAFSDSPKMTLDQVLRLVDQLSADEQEQLRLMLNGKAWGAEWERLSQEIQTKFQADSLPVPTEEEVMAEIKAVRNQRKTERA